PRTSPRPCTSPTCCCPSRTAGPTPPPTRSRCAATARRSASPKGRSSGRLLGDLEERLARDLVGHAEGVRPGRHLVLVEERAGLALRRPRGLEGQGQQAHEPADLLLLAVQVLGRHGISPDVAIR